MRLGVSEIFEKISKEKDALKRQDMLAKHHTNQCLTTMLKLAFDPNLNFNLPEGDPPYKPCQFLDQQTMLYSSMRTLYLFVGEGNPKVPKAKKEVMFINMLESLDPADAKLVLAVKAKQIPYEGITAELVRNTFPGLLPAEEPKPAKVTKKKKVVENE